MKRLRRLLGAFMFGWNPQPTPTTPPPQHGGEPIPDRIATEPIVGYRTWIITNTGYGLGLRSIHKDWVWSNPATAECVQPVTPFLPTQHHKGSSPDINCQCGLYAQLPSHSLDAWEQMTHSGVSASGTIAMSGRIIRCERGYKAEHAVIQSPVVLEVKCTSNCDWPATRIYIPQKPMMKYWAACPEHDARGPNWEGSVSVEPAAWLRYAAEELSATYNVEFISWTNL